MKKPLFKTLVLALVIALAFSMMAGCGGDGNTEGEGNQSDGPRTDVIIATANEPPTLAPYKHSAVASTYMNLLTHDNFFRTDIETLEPIPGIIKEYEILSDKQWKFTIRDDVKFHNGEMMTTADMVASMEYARENQSYTSNYSNFWESIEIIDDYNFIVNTKEVYAKTLNDMASHRVLPKSLIDAGNDFNTNCIGSGPYKLVKQTLGDSVEFEAYDEYWGGAPAIKKMTWRIIPEGSSRTIALEAGEIDMIIEVETNDLTRLQETDGITVVNIPGTSFNFLTLNNEKAPFDNQDFRHALNCAINKDELVEVALNGAGTGNYMQTPPMFPGHSERNLDEYNIDLAKQWLESSGLDPATITFSCICSDDTKRRAGEVIQAALSEVGINMELESMDLATYLSAAAEGNFEATIGGCTTSNTLGFIEYKFTSWQIGGSNFTRTNDAHLDELWTTASQTLDETERLTILEEAAAYLNEICPHVPMYSVNVVRAYNSNLQGFEVNASGNTYWQNVSWAV